MSEEQNKSEREIVPNPEGYTLVKYSEFIVLMSCGISAILFLLFAGLFLKGDDGEWLVDSWLWWLLAILFPITGWLIAHKLTEAKVNIKLSEKGLEQIRLSGSRFVPEYRFIPWDNMRKFYHHGRNRSVEFLICVRKGVNYRISMPILFTIFERQKSNDDVLDAFRTEFCEVAIEHGIRPAFYVLKKRFKKK